VAKKAKTPPPPRRVQAPRTRTGEPDPRRVRMILYTLAGGGLIALAAVLIVVFTGGSSGGGVSGGNVGSLMSKAGCEFKTVDASIPEGEQTHMTNLAKPLDKMGWNTFPPSNGQHYPAWAVWDFYTDPVNPRQVVHNEEHGGVILWWGTAVSQATVEKLRAFYNEDPAGMLGTPIANFGSKVAITAWTGDPAKYARDGYYGQGHIATCTTYTDATKKAFEAFRDAYRDHGPEGVPISNNQPGMGPG
jgi:hypothetical protein